jgi:hypothetical protein
MDEAASQSRKQKAEMGRGKADGTRPVGRAARRWKRHHHKAESRKQKAESKPESGKAE